MESGAVRRRTFVTNPRGEQYMISTVFLPYIDVHETLVFRARNHHMVNALELDGARSRTFEEARKIHAAMAEKWKN